MLLEPLSLSNRALCLAAIGVSLAALAGALMMEHWGGLQPCVLCYYQRYAYLLVIALALPGLIVNGKEQIRRIWAAVLGLAFLGGAGLAFFHVGVEQKWWKGTAECHAPEVDFSASIDQQLDNLLNQPFVACDAIPWSFLGISIAGYNGLFALACALVCFTLLGYRRSAAGKKGL